MQHCGPADVSHKAEAFPPFRFPPDCHWFALRVRAQWDFVAERYLNARGIETFVPCWAEVVRWSDRTKTVQRPYFAGYIFARFAPAAAADVIRIPGVVQILPTSIDPIRVPDEEIENVRRVIASQLPVAPCPYEAGEAVSIESGPLAGVSGVVVRTKGMARLVVRVPAIMGAVNVELDADTVAKA